MNGNGNDVSARHIGTWRYVGYRHRRYIRTMCTHPPAAPFLTRCFCFVSNILTVFYYLCTVPGTAFVRSFSSSLLFVTQIRGHIAGTLLPSPLRYGYDARLHFDRLKSSFSIFFPRRLTSKFAYRRCHRRFLRRLLHNTIRFWGRLELAKSI